MKLSAHVYRIVAKSILFALVIAFGGMQSSLAQQETQIDFSYGDYCFDEETAAWAVTDICNKCCCNETPPENCNDTCDCLAQDRSGEGHFWANETHYTLYRALENGLTSCAVGACGGIERASWCESPLVVDCTGAGDLPNGTYDLEHTVFCTCDDCDDDNKTWDIGKLTIYRTPDLKDSDFSDENICKVRLKYEFFQAGTERLLTCRKPSGEECGLYGYQTSCDQGETRCDDPTQEGVCCLNLTNYTEDFIEVQATACNGNPTDETRTVLISVPPGCGEETKDPLGEPIHADDCEDKNTNEPNTGPMVSPGFYAPTGNFRYAESDPLPTWAPFLTIRMVDSMNDDTGIFGRGWFSAFDASVEEVFPDLPGWKYYRVTTEDNLNVYFRAEGETYQQVWPTNGPVGSFEAKNDGGPNPVEFIYTEPDDRYIRRYQTHPEYRLSRIDDVRTGKSIQITYYANGVPESVVESDGNWSWAVTEHETFSGRVGSISADETTLTYSYSGTSGDQLDSVWVNGSDWRSYTYDPDGRLESVKDGVDNFITEATYIDSSDPDHPGRVFSVSNRNTEITGIEYDVTAGDVNTAAGEYVVRVTQASGAYTDYYIRPVPGGPDKVTMIRGDCSGCGGTGEFTVLGYDAFGRLERKQNAMGAITEWTYDPVGRVSEKKEGYTLDAPACEPLGSPYCYVTGETELMDENTELYDAGVTTTTFTYDDWDWRYRPTQVCRPSVVEGGDVACQSLEFDASTGTPVSEVMSGWTWDHDDLMEEHEERTTTTELYGESSAARFNPVTEADSVGVTDLTFQNGWASAFTPQPAELVAEVNGPLPIGPEADITEFVYYPIDPIVPPVLRGRLAARRDPTGSVTFYDSYDASGRVLRLIDARGVKTDFKYDALGRVLSETVLGNCNSEFGFDLDPNCADSLVTSYLYEARTGPLQSITRPSGASVTVYDYDGWGRTQSISRGPATSDIKERVLYGYDENHWGRVESEELQEPDGAEGWDTRKMTEYEYEGFGRLYRTFYPRKLNDTDVPFDEYVYDPAGNVRFFGDGNHATGDPNVEYEYDVLGRLVRVRALVTTDPPNPHTWATTEYEYDANNNLVLVRDAEEFETQYAVDDFGQTYEIDSPATGITELTYDAGGRLTTREDARGVEESRNYDLSGRLKRSVVEFDDGLDVEQETIIFEYEKGYQIQADAIHVDSSTTTQGQVFGRRGLILELTQDGEETVQFEYDADGNLVERTRGSCESITNLVDWAGRPTRITVMPSTCSGQLTIANNVRYFPFGPVTHVSRLTGLVYDLEEDFEYDLQYRMASQSFERTRGDPETLIDRSYGTPNQYDGYDGAGNLLLVTDSVMPERDRTYVYDDMGRLVEAAAPNSVGDLDYVYDLVGNRTRYEYGPEGEKSYDDYTYDAVSGLLSTITELRFPGKETTYSLTHDAVGNLTVESAPSSQDYGYSLRNKMVTHNGLLSFKYDAHGRRVKSTRDMGLAPQESIKHYPLPDGRPYIDKPEGFAPAPQWSYAYLGERLLARFNGSGNFEYVVSDHIGFPIATIDREGMLLWQPDPLPFGKIYAEESVGPGHDPLLRYPGQWSHDPLMDANEPEFSTLYYNFHRWYKPSWGRYTQTDPIGVIGGLHFASSHLFLYAVGSPVNHYDREGLLPSGMLDEILPCIICLFEAGGKGAWNSEFSMWVTCNTDGGYDCHPWPRGYAQGTSVRSSTSWPAGRPLPQPLCANFHTHPRKKPPRPTSNDLTWAKRLNIPFCSIHPAGVFCYYPDGHGEQHTGKGWYKEHKNRCIDCEREFWDKER